MSKAEELAKVYLKEKGYLLVSNNGEHMAEVEAMNLYIAGYHQAEKDLELTWEDIRELYIIFAEVDVGIKLCKTNIQAETIGYYQEVLKRFNKERKEVKGKG